MKKLSDKAFPFFSRLSRDERGTQLVETAVWIGLITAAVIVTVQTLGTEVGVALNKVAALLPAS